MGTDETSKRQKVQVIEAALQVVNEECTEFIGGGEELDPVKLSAGRKDEEEYMTKHEVFEESSAEECWRKTGKAPTSTRWPDVKKTLDDGVEIVRCRLASRDWWSARAIFCCDSSMGSQDVDGQFQEKEA